MVGAMATRFAIRVLVGVLATALAVAYGVIAAGLLGWLDARAVSLWTICMGAIALMAAAGYFALSTREISRRFSSAA